MRILVLGASGMLGHTLTRVLASINSDIEIIAASRSNDIREQFPDLSHITAHIGVDVENSDSLLELFTLSKPDCVINCIGLVKQKNASNDPLVALPINALLPHRLVRLCTLCEARLIHISTDCVFRGDKGNYDEKDNSDAVDLYGKSKYLGEVSSQNCITLRTSIIGPELNSSFGLLEWFLSQKTSVKGFKNAIFSGLPTNELASIIVSHVLPHPELSGLFHVSAKAISKFDLLSIIAHVYGKEIKIKADEEVRIDRSLNSTLFRAETGYIPPEWHELIRGMHQLHKKSY
jgi:dTDP-4-dehydrorhamnose reductase